MCLYLKSVCREETLYTVNKSMRKTLMGSSVKDKIDVKRAHGHC